MCTRINKSRCTEERLLWYNLYQIRVIASTLTIAPGSASVSLACGQDAYRCAFCGVARGPFHRAKPPSHKEHKRNFAPFAALRELLFIAQRMQSRKELTKTELFCNGSFIFGMTIAPGNADMIARVRRNLSKNFMNNYALKLPSPVVYPFHDLFGSACIALVSVRERDPQQLPFAFFCCSCYTLCKVCGSSSVGRATPCQGVGRGFESRLPLHIYHPVPRPDTPKVSRNTLRLTFYLFCE
jgi:hypothetical protein